MRVGIDITPLQTGHRFRGIGSYVRNLVQALGRIDQQTEYFLVAYASSPTDLPPLPANFRIVPFMGRSLGRMTGLVSHQLVLPFLVGRLRLDLFHATSVATSVATPGIPVRLPVPKMVTVYDLIPLVYPDLFLRAWRNRLLYRLMIRAIRNAQHVVAISAWTKSEAVRLLGYPSRRITTIPLAPDPIFQPSVAQGRDERSPVGRRYVLHVGGHHPNKNLERLLEGYAALQSTVRREHILVLVGELSSNVETLVAQHPDLRDQIVHFEKISTDDLARLYRHADLFVFPSTAEGFGLPILEAMASGCPVVTSDCPPLPELAGGAAILVDPHNVDSIVSGIERALKDATVRAELQDQGLQRVRQFTWEETADRTIDVYHRIAEGRAKSISVPAARTLTETDVVLSLVVPTYGREQLLCNTLRHLLAMDLYGSEIIVVDQTPQHDAATREYLASIADRIRYLRSDTPNLPRARNLGWKSARGDVVLFVDDDVIPHPGLLEAHRRGYDDPEVGGVAGRVITTGIPLPEKPSVKSRLPGVGWLFFNFAQATPGEVMSARGCNMSFRREVIEEIGGFDESYTMSPSSREDSDFCFRTVRRGYRLVFEPKAALEHLMHREGGQRTVDRDPALSPAHHINNFYFFWKNIPWRHRPLTFLILLVQEFRPGRAGVRRRSWRANLQICRLFARGVWLGWRRARTARIPRPFQMALDTNPGQTQRPPPEP